MACSYSERPSEAPRCPNWSLRGVLATLGPVGASQGHSGAMRPHSGQYVYLYIPEPRFVLQIRIEDKRSFEHTYLSQPVVLEIKSQSLPLVYIYILKIRMDDKRRFEHTYLSHPVVFEIKC